MNGGDPRFQDGAKGPRPCPELCFQHRNDREIALDLPLFKEDCQMCALPKSTYAKWPEDEIQGVEILTPVYGLIVEEKSITRRYEEWSERYGARDDE